MKRFLILFLIISPAAFAQESWPTYVSPLYYGPNAFPVPDILDHTESELELEIHAGSAAGHLSEKYDHTDNVGFSIRVPLWTSRVNFSAWGELFEYYKDTDKARVIRGIPESVPLTGKLFGDLYFSVDANVLLENERRPGIIVRAACKTASSKSNEAKRYYDAPGYFFDCSVFKGFTFVGKHTLGIAASTGFLCWQVRSNRQNDAVMYGAAISYEYSEILKIKAEYGGYTGWRQDGDGPMTLKVKADFLQGRRVSPFIEYHHGFRDWPYDQIKIGARFYFDIFKRNLKEFSDLKKLD